MGMFGSKTVQVDEAEAKTQEIPWVFDMMLKRMNFDPQQFMTVIQDVMQFGALMKSMHADQRAIATATMTELREVKQRVTMLELAVLDGQVASDLNKE